MNILRKIEQQKQKLEQLEQAFANEMRAEEIAVASFQAYLNGVIEKGLDLAQGIKGTATEKTLAKMLKGVQKYVETDY